MIECFGLPGIGKTTFFDKVIASEHSDAEHVPASGFDLHKARNIARGLVHSPSILRIAVWGIGRRHNIYTFRRYMILFERIGRLTHRNGAAVDEGPLQAVWALFHNLELSSENRRHCETLLSKLYFGQTIQYVCASSAMHSVFSDKRIRKHRYAAMDDLEKKIARSWMAIILRHARLNRTALKYYRVTARN